jgi:hypothetical protein
VYSQGIEGNDKISPLEGRLRGVKEIEIMSFTSHTPRFPVTIFWSSKAVLFLLKGGKNDLPL